MDLPVYRENLRGGRLCQWQPSYIARLSLAESEFP